MEGTRRQGEVIGNLNEPWCLHDTVHVRRLQMKNAFERAGRQRWQNKRFSVKAIHRLLHQAPSPCQRLRHRGPRCQEPACPLASAEQMSLICPPPPQTPPPLPLPPPLTGSHGGGVPSGRHPKV
ncbi:hypothetical protein NQZ68_002735 [Dissostichus eleginoides]|nr:hypothetical protein NQZ68_002735 [Dissostichus eleginoides]